MDYSRGLQYLLWNDSERRTNLCRLACEDLSFHTSHIVVLTSVLCWCHFWSDESKKSRLTVNKIRLCVLSGVTRNFEEANIDVVDLIS
jgi:hypothetical protein